ncbi:MAG: hypothetical protein COY81_02875 [Candidatus Pacebacteria bacterium CG_4_10_14_0_8_um_filter_43_12]|nr:MAG: hypothetical protein COU66_00990 [Candidatus Pacebacteria bacterium CG10_big_fil_rev_8_21_14_0_10_44_11]PIY79334.1 MAG: hypothetical protein COY81_02875 [Candidatus Pacebacteria bacterium CG_4_10_14_0_8_um_filter_43_12]
MGELEQPKDFNSSNEPTINSVIDSLTDHSPKSPFELAQESELGLPQEMVRILNQDYNFPPIVATQNAIAFGKEASVFGKETKQFDYIAVAQPRLYRPKIETNQPDTREQQLVLEYMTPLAEIEIRQAASGEKPIPLIYLPLEHLYLRNLDGASSIDLVELIRALLPENKKNIRIIISSVASWVAAGNQSHIHSPSYSIRENCIYISPINTIGDIFGLLHEVGHAISGTDDESVFEGKVRLKKLADLSLTQGIIAGLGKVLVTGKNADMAVRFLQQLENEKETLASAVQPQDNQNLVKSERNAHAIAGYLAKSLRDNRGFLDFSNQEFFEHIEYMLSSYEGMVQTSELSRVGSDSYFTNEKRRQERKPPRINAFRTLFERIGFTIKPLH